MPWELHKGMKSIFYWLFSPEISVKLVSHCALSFHYAMPGWFPTGLWNLDAESLHELKRLWEFATVIYLYESCSLFKIFTSQVSHLCGLSDCFIHISKLGMSILRVKMKYFHLSKKWACLDDFRWAFNLKTCHKSWWNGFRNIVYKEQVTCLGKMNAFM